MALMSGGWAVPRDHFEPVSPRLPRHPLHAMRCCRARIGAARRRYQCSPPRAMSSFVNACALCVRASSALQQSKPLLRGKVALESTFSAPSNIAGSDAAAPRGSVSSRRGFGRPPPPKFTETVGPLQVEEATAMFRRMDLNMDGIITHAELMRGVLNNPEIARRLESSGDSVLQNLVRKIVQREVLLPDEDEFTLGEWINLCEPTRSGSVAQFVEAYELDRYYDNRAAEAAERLAQMHSQRIGDASPLKEASSILERSMSTKARTEDALRRQARATSATSTGLGQFPLGVPSTPLDSTSPSSPAVSSPMVSQPASRPLSAGEHSLNPQPKPEALSLKRETRNREP